MKIVHVINSLATGGAERMVVELATHGVRRGHDVRVVVLADTEGMPRRIADERGIPIAVAATSLRDPRILVRLRNLTVGADVVHVHLFPAMYWAATLGGPKVFTEHSTHNRRMGRRLYRLPERWAYNNYDRVVAIGPGVERRLRQHAAGIGSGTRVVTALNGVADEFYAVNTRTHRSGVRLLSVGSLTEVKQHAVAIEAMRLLPDATLDIAGEGPLRRELETQIVKAGLQSRVRLLGNVKDVHTLLSSYTLLLSTSKYEGFGLVAAEAQAAGLPVVGPAVEGFDDVVLQGRSGLVFGSATPEEIAARVRAAIEPSQYARLVAGALANSRRFTMSNSFEANYAVYKSVIREVGSSR